MDFQTLQKALVQRALAQGDKSGAEKLMRATNASKLKDILAKNTENKSDTEKLSGFSSKYEPHMKQKNFHELGREVRERLFLAGNRCGKTLCGSFEMACHLTGVYPDWWAGVRFSTPIQAWAASVTVGATRDILQRLYLGDGHAGKGGLIPKHLLIKQSLKAGVANAVDEVWVRHASGGVSCLGFKSYDMGRAKFQGTARHVIHLDEEPPIDIYEECLMRTATTAGHMMLSMTPLEGLTPLVERFLNDASTHFGVVKAGWQDAPHLGAAEQQRLRAGIRPHEVAARERGEPVLGVGRVFPLPESDISVPRFKIPPHWPRAFGLDFGWSNPTAAVWIAHDPDEDIIYITDTYAQSEATPAEHAAAILARTAASNALRPILGVCDPAGQSASQSDGQSLMTQYAKHGIRLERAENAVESGLMTLLERFQSDKLKVFSDLEDWFAEFRVYRRGRDGRIIKRNDHLLDASRYAVMSGLPLIMAAASIGDFQRETADWRTA